MKNKDGKNPGTKDRDDVNKFEKHESKYEAKRKTMARNFGGEGWTDLGRER
jgi:hypothetical protein